MDSSIKQLIILIKYLIFLAIFVFAPLSAISETLSLDTITPSTNSPVISPQPDTLTSDWSSGKSWLKEQGFDLKPRLTLFNQSLISGDDTHGFELGGKADLLLNTNLSKLGFWNGLYLTIHSEYNFGDNTNNRDGALLPVNTALLLPGSHGADAFDISSVYFSQRLTESTSIMFGKINMVDIAAGKPFMGGAGIDSFQHIAFVAPPSGIFPPYMFGGILNIKTEPANFTVMLYDPVSAVNKSGLQKPFNEGVSVRGSVEIPVLIAGLSGHQGFSATYSTQNGTDLAGLGDIFLPPPVVVNNSIKNYRYHISYSFDQYLYQSKENPNQGIGLFGQIGLSDGNPNPLDWNVILGLGGSGLIQGRPQDNWGIGYFHYSLSKDLKQSLAPIIAIGDEKGLELFYNVGINSHLQVGADLQIIDPAIEANKKAVYFGLRSVIKF